MFLFLFKILRRAFFAIVVAGVVIAAIALSGCGKFTPAENVTVTLPDSGTEQETPDTEAPDVSEDDETESTYLEAKLSVNDTIELVSLYSYTGEIKDVNVSFEYGETCDNATMYISPSSGSVLLEAGITYCIYIKNNGGYFWDDAFGIYALDENSLAWEIIDWNEGITVYTPTYDVYSLKVQLLPSPVTAAGTVDFYISIFID